MTKLYASSPNDSLVFKNGNEMSGEIKSMDRGVVIKGKKTNAVFRDLEIVIISETSPAPFHQSILLKHHWQSTLQISNPFAEFLYSAQWLFYLM